MRITKNNDFIRYYLEGGNKQTRCGNLYIVDNKLFNYDTILAIRWDDEDIEINMTKYSTSSSKIQNVLKKEAAENFKNINILYAVEMGSQEMVNNY